MTGAPDPHTEPVRAAIDSTVMLVLARFLMPVVVAILGDADVHARRSEAAEP